MSTTTSTRDWSLDAARALLLSLGIFLHAANIYAVNSGWIIQDPVSSPFFNVLTGFIHHFRIPAFFWLSGYFAALSFGKLGYGQTLKNRLIRLGIPLFATWFLINRLQQLFTGGPQAVTPILGIPPLFHLWFLIDLMCMIALTVALDFVLSRLKPWLDRPLRLHWLVILVLLTLISTGFSMAARLTGIAYTEWFGVTSLYRIFTGLSFFAVGFAMFRHRTLKHSFLSTPYYFTALIALATLLLDIYVPHLTGWQAEILQILGTFAAWTFIALVMKLCATLFREGTPALKAIVASAYTVYLFHHFLVVALGTALFGSVLPIAVKYLIVCSTTLLLTFAIHHWVVEKIPLLKLVFNGHTR